MLSAECRLTLISAHLELYYASRIKALAAWIGFPLGYFP